MYELTVGLRLCPCLCFIRYHNTCDAIVQDIGVAMMRTRM
jgi:hypothetical protein